jgi:GH18 family chitinase
VLGTCDLGGRSPLQPNDDLWGWATVNGALWGTNDAAVIAAKKQDGVSPLIAPAKLNVGVAAYGHAWRRVVGSDPLFPDPEGNQGKRDENTVSEAEDTSTAAWGVPSPYGPNLTEPTDPDDLSYWVWGPGQIPYRGIERLTLDPTFRPFLVDRRGSVFGYGKRMELKIHEDTHCRTPASYAWARSGDGKTGGYVTYESPASAKAKAAFARGGAVGGIFLFELSGDSGTLLENIHKGLGSTVLP